MQTRSASTGVTVWSNTQVGAGQAGSGYASFCALQDSTFVVVWNEFAYASNTYTVKLQRYVATGTALGAVVIVYASSSMQGIGSCAPAGSSAVHVFWTYVNSAGTLQVARREYTLAPVVVAPVVNQEVVYGKSLGLQLLPTMFDGANPPISMSVSTACSWMIISSNGYGGYILGSSPQSMLPCTTYITGTDTTGRAASTQFTLTPTNSGPYLALPISAQSAKVGDVFALPLPANTFIDPDGNTLTYAVTSSAAWLQLTSLYTGQLQGTPTAPGTVDVTISATDGVAYAYATFTVAVADSDVVTTVRNALLGVGSSLLAFIVGFVARKYYVYTKLKVHPLAYRFVKALRLDVANFEDGYGRSICNAVNEIARACASNHGINLLELSTTSWRRLVDVLPKLLQQHEVTIVCTLCLNRNIRADAFERKAGEIGDAVGRFLKTGTIEPPAVIALNPLRIGSTNAVPASTATAALSINTGTAAGVPHP
jgi:hypothetical protein